MSSWTKDSAESSRQVGRHEFDILSFWREGISASWRLESTASSCMTTGHHKHDSISIRPSELFQTRVNKPAKGGIQIKWMPVDR